jgi:hypothetical protein
MGIYALVLFRYYPDVVDTPQCKARLISRMLLGYGILGIVSSVITLLMMLNWLCLMIKDIDLAGVLLSCITICCSCMGVACLTITNSVNVGLVVGMSVVYWSNEAACVSYLGS